MHSDRRACFMFFLFLSFVHHPDLHSFPTRRSSDLLWQVNLATGHRSGRSRPQTAITLRGRKRAPIRIRSEEHTSELQSHHEFVCRLLLEKKKSNPFSSRT